jgi:hypothetical protein
MQKSFREMVISARKSFSSAISLIIVLGTIGARHVKSPCGAHPTFAIGLALAALSGYNMRTFSRPFWQDLLSFFVRILLCREVRLRRRPDVRIIFCSFSPLTRPQVLAPRPCRHNKLHFVVIYLIFNSKNGVEEYCASWFLSLAFS